MTGAAAARAPPRRRQKQLALQGPRQQLGDLPAGVERLVCAGRALVVGPVDNQAGGEDNVDGVPGAFPDGSAAAANMRFNRTGLIGPRNVFRSDGLFNADLAFGKRFRLPMEGDSLQLRWEVFNAFNNVNFTPRNLQRRYDRPAVLEQYRFTESPRIMQFALRYEF